MIVCNEQIDAKAQSLEKDKTEEDIKSEKNQEQKAQSPSLKRQTNLEQVLSTIPEDKRSISRALLLNNVIQSKEKVVALRELLQNTEAFNKSLQFLMQHNQKPKTILQKPLRPYFNRIYYPNAQQEKFLPNITPENRKSVKEILEENIKIEEKFELLKAVLSSTSDLKDLELCREFLRKMRSVEKLIKDFPLESKNDVLAILNIDSLEFEEKRSLLRYVLKNPAHRKECRRFLRKLASSTKKEIDSSEDQFNLKNRQVFDQLPDETNILILGETGVGKSTFINGLANYLNFRNLYEAKDEGPIVLIKTYFTQTGNKNEPIKIEIDSTIEEGKDNNENLENGLSSTLKTKCYQFIFGPTNKKKSIRLIDTPGAGDVSGLKRDTENFENIFQFLADFREIHAICVLLKPNESKLTVNFRYTLGELFSRLHVSARRNVLFCFNNTRGTLYKPGETIATLQVYLKELEELNGIQIPLTRSSLFCFEQESYRFLCALKKGIGFSNKLVEDFNGSWKVSVNETFRFFQRVAQLPAYQVEETLVINNLREVLKTIAIPMAQCIHASNTIDGVIKEKQSKIDELTQQINSLSTNPTTTRLTYKAVSSGRVDTVCATCAISKGNEKEYKICHMSCNCNRVKLNTCQEVKLQQCSCINKQTLHCSNCGCFWNVHMQINTILQQSNEKVADTVVHDQIAHKNAKRSALQNELQNVQRQKAETSNKTQTFLPHFNMFISFLKQNALLPYNMHFKEYVERAINEEKQKVGQGGSENELIFLEEMSAQFEQQLILFNNTSGQCLITKEGIKDNLNSICNNKSGSSFHQELKSLLNTWIHVRSKPMNRKITVNLNKGWIGSLYKSK